MRGSGEDNHAAAAARAPAVPPQPVQGALEALGETLLASLWTHAAPRRSARYMPGPPCLRSVRRTGSDARQEVRLASLNVNRRYAGV